MNENIGILVNADILEIVVAPPEGHQYLHANGTLQSGEAIMLHD